MGGGAYLGGVYSPSAPTTVAPVPAILPILNRLRADGRQVVVLKYSHRHTRCKVSTGVAVLPECFDAEALAVLPRAKGTRTGEPNPKARQQTLTLRRYQDALSEAVQRCALDGVEPEAGKVKAMVTEALKGTETPPEGPLASDYMRELVDRRGTEFAKLTGRTYLTTAGRLDRFAKGVRIGQMDMKWRDGYVASLRAARLKPGTIWGEAKQLRTMLNDAETHGHVTPKAHERRGWMPKQVTVDTYSLTADEITALRAVDLPRRLDRVRDLFLFSTATGMRYSELRDLQMAEWDHTPDRAQVRFYATKTDAWKIVPLNAEARRIAAKWDGAPPKVATNQKLNEYLKEVGTAAGLTRTVPKSRTGEPVPLAESLSMHDARRTFATLAWRAGVPPATIMGLTGHTTEKQLRAYINVTDAEAADDARRHSHFA